MQHIERGSERSRPAATSEFERSNFVDDNGRATIIQSGQYTVMSPTDRIAIEVILTDGWLLVRVDKACQYATLTRTDVHKVITESGVRMKDGKSYDASN